MRKHVSVSRLVLVVLLLAVAAFGTMALGKGKPPKFNPCPNWNIFCLDVWDPVTCDNGVTYSNQCYADRACATGCEPGYPSW